MRSGATISNQSFRSYFCNGDYWRYALRTAFLLFEYSMTFHVRYLANSSVFRKPKISFPPELRKRIKRDLELDYGKDNVCTCSLLADGTCSEDSNCENRSAQIECGSDCKVKNCQNRKFTKRMYPPLHKFKTWWGGFGLEAKQKITGMCVWRSFPVFLWIFKKLFPIERSVGNIPVELWFGYAENHGYGK